MRKHFLLLMLTALLPLAGWAATAKPGANTVFTFDWTNVGGVKTAVITGFVNGATKGAITIPATVDFPEDDGLAPSTFNVIEIAANAFEGETAITSVDFAASSNLTTIGEEAFLGCTGMTSVNFTNATKLTTIDARAFKGTKITALDLSATKLEAVTNILGTNYTGPVSNKTLTTVVLPATVTGIAEGAFANCTDLATFTINGSKAGFTIGVSAFRGTAIETLDLEKTTLANVVNMFGTVYDGANSINNNKLKTVKLPKTWGTIATKAFENCTALSTISLKPAAEITAATQTIESLAFNGTALTTLNFTDTKVTGIPEKLLMDGTNVEKNTSLQTVTLNATIVDLNASFANCEALATVIIPEASTLIALEDNEFKGDKALVTINTSKIQNFGVSAFEGCAALKSINLAACVADGLSNATFKDAGLESVSFPKTVTIIPQNCFNGCEKLATVNFGHGDADAFNHIGQYAFAYTKIAAIIIPKTLPLDATDGIESKAFGGCEQLKSFTFKPESAPEATVINVNAFLGCSGVMFYTTDDYMSDPDVTGEKQPKNITYVTSATPAAVTPFTTTKFANGENKYYIKWKGANDIKIKKNEAKVYDAYLDDEWHTLNMIQFKSSGGYVYIKAGQVALIITEKEDLSYEANDANKHTSWISFTDAEHNEQVLQILGADQSRLDLEEAAPAGRSIYGWVNSANNKKTGFQKITSGKTFKAGTLYVYAKEEPAAAPGLNVVWLDENGFVEENTTAISDIIAEPAQENGEMFNLQGIRVNSAAQKGIYIKNGKKFVVK